MAGWATSGTGLAVGAAASAAIVVVVVATTGKLPETTNDDVAAPAVVIEAPVQNPVEEGITQPEMPVYGGPVFDLVRVQPDGSTVIAGTGTARSEITVVVDNGPLAEGAADGAGSFAFVLDLPPTGAPQSVVLRETLADGSTMTSAETVLISARTLLSEATPKIVLAGPEGLSVLQMDAEPAPKVQVAAANVSLASDVASVTSSAPETQSDVNENSAAPSSTDDLSLDVISYDTEGDVIVAGRGKVEQVVRVYVDNTLVDTGAVTKDGNWQVVLTDVDSGVYNLRIDEVAPTGRVTSRVESPFKREDPTAAVLAKLSPSGDQATPASITVQPGHTLWALAHAAYGDGVHFVGIYEANKELIRDPNLIYPGQVLDLPD